MLRFIFLLFGMLLSFTGFAGKSYAASSAVLSFTSDMTYSHDFKKIYDPYPEVIDKAISHFAFNKLVGHGDFLTVNSLDQMNRIYIPRQYGESSDQRLILAKSGFEVTGAVKYGEIYEASAGYIVHFKAKGSGDVALFFKGFRIEGVLKIKEEIAHLLNSKSQAETFFPVKNNLMQILFFPLAHAEELQEAAGALCGKGLGVGDRKKMNASALEQLWGCTKGFAGGIWDSTGGVVTTVVKGSYQILTHPVDTFNKASAEFSQISGLFSEIEGAFGELKTAFQALPQDLKVKIGCEITGSIGTTALIAFFTSASGSPLLFRAIAAALQKVVSALPQGLATTAKVATLAKGMESKAEAAQANLELIKKIKDTKNLAKETAAEMEMLKPQLTKGRDPENLSSQLKDLETELDPTLSAGERKKKMKELKETLARQSRDYEAAKSNYSRLKALQKESAVFLKDMKNNKSATVPQKAAVAAYFAASSCSRRSSVSEAIGSATSAGAR